MLTKNIWICVFFYSQENKEMSHMWSSLSVWNTSPYMLIKQEKLVYTVESLVAEFGGTLGLFLGFSFMNLWDLVEIATGYVPDLIDRMSKSS